MGAAGPSNELWSLRGVFDFKKSEGRGEEKNSNTKDAAQWTQLQLNGTPPAPRRGHVVATADVLGGVVFVGGLSEQKSILGIKKQPQYLMDVVLLQPQSDTLMWRQVEVPERVQMSVNGNQYIAGPVGRERHSIVALKDGRLLLFGGTFVFMTIK